MMKGKNDKSIAGETMVAIWILIALVLLCLISVIVTQNSKLKREYVKMQMKEIATSYLEENDICDECIQVSIVHKDDGTYQLSGIGAFRCYTDNATELEYSNIAPNLDMELLKSGYFFILQNYDVTISDNELVSKLDEFYSQTLETQ